MYRNETQWNMYENERSLLISELENVSSASITMDTWTSNTTTRYMTVTEHHITSDWGMKSNILMTRAMLERQTRQNIMIKLKDRVSEFELDSKISGSVHDNACNMECTGSMCEE